MPVIDTLSDFAFFTVLLSLGQYAWATLVLLVILLSFRFQALYAALTPTPELGVIQLLVPVLSCLQPKASVLVASS